MSTRANRCENRDYYAYSSQGNRTGHDIYSGTGILPAYLDGDQQPIGSFEQMKSGQGMTQDMTQMIGSLDLAKESGGAGEGANGNPDVPGNGNATFFQNNGRKGFYAGGQWHDTGFHTLPAYPSERHLPGMGTDKAPTSAPPTAQDEATQADKRLKDTWAAQKFHGPKPGKQTGSRYYDDDRDMFSPLPAYLPTGGVTGPSGFAPGGRWTELCPLPEPLLAYYGPAPMLPNPAGDRDTEGGDGNTWKPPENEHGAEMAPGLNEDTGDNSEDDELTEEEKQQAYEDAMADAMNESYSGRY